MRHNCNPHGYSSETFENCVDYYGVSISDWDVSGVTDMSYLFTGDLMYMSMYNNGLNAAGFNADISRWDVSLVTNMNSMFYRAQNFNGDLSNWNTANTWSSANARYNAYGMFNSAPAWQNKYVYRGVGNYGDGPPEDWCLNDGSRCPFPRNGNTLKVAVANCLNANPDGNCDCSWVDCKHGIGHRMNDWDVSKVTDMNSLFKDGNVVTVNNYMPISYQVTINSQNFNADISTWNTASVTSMSYMFQNAHNFNGDISRWNTQSLAHMEKMFENAHSFNADITKWTCDAYESQRTRSQVEDMFKGADAWHASYVNTHTGYFDLNLGPPNMWVPVDEYKEDSSFFAKDKRVQILIAFVAVLGAGLLGVVVFLIVRCATHRKRTAKKVTTQFRIAHAHNAVSQQQMLAMSPMPPGAPVLPGRSPIVVTLPAPAPPTAAPAQQV